MNMWGLTPSFVKALEAGFPEFLKGPGAQDLKAEYLLPTIIDQMIRRGQAKVAVLETKDKWFGVTYKEDKEVVSQAIRELCRQGVYEDCLFQAGR